MDASQANLAQSGRRAWAKLHAWAEEYRREVGGACPCGDMAVQAAQGLHDAVNVHLGKPTLHPESLTRLSTFIQEAVVDMGASKKPICTPAQLAKLERCIQEVKAKGGAQNPWAVCTESIGCRKGQASSSQSFRNALQAFHHLARDADYFEVGINEDGSAGITAVKNNRRISVWTFEDGIDRPMTVYDYKKIATFPQEKGYIFWTDNPQNKEDALHTTLQQSFLDFLVGGAAQAVGATLGSVLATRLLTSSSSQAGVKVVDKPKDKPSTASMVFSPSKVEGDQAEIDVGNLLQEIDTILRNPDRLGEVNPATLKVTRAGA